MTTFKELGCSPDILSALKKIKYETPSPIQEKAIPLIHEGVDLIALAETGSGKTAACAIPVCERIDTSKKNIQALILVPTRELALQYATETQKIGNHKGVSVISVLGGEDYGLQKSKIAHGVHVCVATPGRLIDFIYSRDIDLSDVETLILDEADEMLSMGFYDDLEFIINCLIHDHQTLLFSATMPAQIKKIAAQHMKSPKELILQSDSATPKNLKHLFVYSQPNDRLAQLEKLISEQKPKQSIVFCESRRDVETLSREMRKKLSGVDFLHGGLSQDARNVVTSKFRNGRVQHMIATDVAARGLDFSGVTHVFLYQLPKDPEVYVHRSGRTGRSGREGTAISFVMPRDQGLLDRVLKQIKMKEASWIGNPPPPRGAQSSQPPRGPRRPARPRRSS